MLKSWREVARPHKDVLEGTFQQSEFAADISRVANGTATEEYQKPENFYARTFVTEGMKQLLVSVAKRLGGHGGDPVIELQTNFGGGKTHTLLAVYHLAKNGCGHAGRVTLPGVAEVLREAEVSDVPQAKIAVIDGTALAPNQPVRIDGLEIRTVWGNIAYQLAGRAGYDKVAESDAAGTSPGKVVIEELLRDIGPCVILMDELVAYYRQFNTSERLTGGTYESNISFVQSLTEAVKGAPKAILLASLPDSNTEAAGAFGAKVLKTLEKTFGRVNSIWRPVSAEEGFEIVKRRLFENITDTAEVDNTCRAFADYYHENKDALPAFLQEGTWGDKMRRCYPIHPEVFARLYEDWSTLEKFQKTRGVLQLMAIVINRLWQRNDDAPLILPASLPLDDTQVVNKCTQYLPNGWGAIIDREMDGAGSSAAAIDRADPRLGEVHAAVRTARAIFLGSAAGCGAQGARGIDVKHILLGCALPGQALSFYGDAIRKMREQQHYLFNQDDNYWYDTRPTLKRTMESYKERYTPTQVNDYLATVVGQKWGSPAVLASKHVFADHRDVPDDITNGLRVVVLPLDLAYTRSSEERTFAAAKHYLDRHGSNPRMRKNRLVFLAADLNSMVLLTDLCRTVLAWRDVGDAIRNQAVNATLQDAAQVQAQQNQAQRQLEGTVVSSFKHLLVPVPEGASGVGFEVLSLATNPASRIGESIEQALLGQDFVVRSWAPQFLKNTLEQMYFRNDVVEVSTRKVWTDMASFYNFPRLVGAEALLVTIARGVSETGLFGYAMGKEGDRYLGLKYGENPGLVNISEAELLIKADVADAYKRSQTSAGNGPGAATAAASGNSSPGGTMPESPSGGTQEGPVPNGGGHSSPAPTTARRQFSGVVTLDLTNGMQPIRQVLDEVLANLAGTGAHVTVQLDISARNVNPFPPTLVRTVSENARSLNFARAEFM